MGQDLVARLVELKQLVGRGSLYVRKEYGVELYHRGHYQRAEKQFRKIVRAAAGEAWELAPRLAGPWGERPSYRSRSASAR